MTHAGVGGPLVLSRNDVGQLLDRGEMVDIVEQVYRAQSAGQTVGPNKSYMRAGDSTKNALFIGMPAYVEPLDAAGLKWVGVGQPARGGGSVTAMVILNDPVTGEPLAVLDATTLTWNRTAAMAVAFAKHLHARPIETVAVVGTGGVGQAAVRCFAELPSVERIHVASRSTIRAREMGARLSDEVDCPVIPHDTGSLAAAEADVVVTATSANEMLVRDDALKPGVTVVALGSYQEVDPLFALTCDRIVVDDLEATTTRGELAPLYASEQLHVGRVSGTIAEVVGGAIIGRESPRERVLGVALGSGTIDVALARHVYSKALPRGLGQRL